LEAGHKYLHSLSLQQMLDLCITGGHHSLQHGRLLTQLLHCLHEILLGQQWDHTLCLDTYTLGIWNKELSHA